MLLVYWRPSREREMPELPTGTVTFLFTDVESSTRLWDESPDGMRQALTRHDVLLREAVESHGGRVVKTTGDGVHGAFATANDAVEAALVAQRTLNEEPWDLVPLRVRMGIHTGEAELRDGDYYGGALNRAARLMSLGHGGQTLVSHVTTELIEESLPAGVGMRDLGEHRLQGLSRPERVFQLSGPGCEHEFPPLRSLDAYPGNLPVQVTSFVGRQEELARVRDELAETRLVTLTGVGGVGKTRLALEVAAEVVPEFRDGAWLVELAGVRDPDAVPDAVLAVFGLQSRTGSSATETLLEFLRNKSLLLVLDNCEHLLRAVGGLVADVVQACPSVRVLATSREGLNVAGERMLGVSSLEVPDEGADVEAIADCDAVALFVDRARATKATFALDPSNAVAVVQVCRRLDGIALAIELAAARVAMLTPAEVARRLDQRFRLLAGGQRSAVERHQTLRAAIDWSYDLLSETEQLLLARLSIFVGGFSLPAAEAVAASGPVAADDVFELLATLVARSLVVADTEGVDTRYRLLETIRQYAQEHLDQSGDGDRLRTEHAAFFADFAEAALPETMGAESDEWERRLGEESENILAALVWAVDNEDAGTAVRLLAAWQSPILGAAGSFASPSTGITDTVLSLPGASEHPMYPAALVLAAFISSQHGDQEEAVRRCDEALAAERRLGTDPSMALWLVRCDVAMAEGHADEAIEHASRAIAMARARREPVWLVWGLTSSALAHAMVGETAAALPEAEEAVALTHRLPSSSIVRVGLGRAAFALGASEPERALALVRAVLESAPEDRTGTWAVAGDLACRTGDERTGLAYFARAIDALRWLGHRLFLGIVLGSVAAVLVDDDPEAAAVLSGAGEAFARDYAHAPHRVEASRRAVTTLGASLGATRLADLGARGTAMDDDEAADYADAAISRYLARNGS